MILKKKASNFLQPINEVMFPERTDVDVLELYRNNKDVYMGDGFEDRILSTTQTTTQTSRAFEMKIVGFDLIKQLTPAEIRSMLPTLYTFEKAAVFCVLLADMMTRQQKGEVGDLVLGGHSNIFYVRGVDGQVFTVDCLWDSGRMRWFLQAYQLNSFPSAAGNRVFSRNR